MNNQPVNNQRTNELGQPIGVDLPEWSIPASVRVESIEGKYVKLEHLRAEHTSDLFEAFSTAADIADWTYLPYGPFETEIDLREWVKELAASNDPWMFALIDAATGKACGVASYLRINPESGSIEVGHIHFSPLVQKTPAATECMYLMAEQAFNAGYRRYEWKCDALNVPSKGAATRLGFTYEGIFRQATVYKGRNRDTAWFAMIDTEWQELRGAFQQWLVDTNFTDKGVQKHSLAKLTSEALGR